MEEMRAAIQEDRFEAYRASFAERSKGDQAPEEFEGLGDAGA
jgi:hypothetical protein